MSASILPACHLLAYSTLLGSTLYQASHTTDPHRTPPPLPTSFVMTKISYAALPTSAFTTLQKRVFPVYFRLQALLLLVAALTYPPPPTTTTTTSSSSSMLALLDAPVADSGLLALAGATAVANWLKYGPATAEAMVARTHQGELNRHFP
ncbi:hypothetical protein SLS58_002200 [Diplodia intermedia]|uniref:TMEM205-like domain-containing protein n=1 Tax=Diplodia intermedia TaxID=856260 RepID=A0ABR3TZY5_9PEZI